MVRDLMDLVSRVRPNFIFLLDVKISRAKADVVRAKINFTRLCFIPSVNNGGGITLMWKDKSSVRLLGLSANFIDVVILSEDTPDWRFTGYYGFPERARCNDSWDILHSLVPHFSLLWYCTGDLNDLLAQSEKIGKVLHPLNLINVFRLTHMDYGLHDIIMKGYPFTWEKGRGTPNLIEE